MDTARRLLTITATMLASLIVGCASEVVTTKQSSQSEQIAAQNKSRYRVVAVNVVSDGKSADIADQLSSAIVLKLRAKGVFERVLSKSVTLEKQFDLIVSVTPTNYQNQDLAQAWLGIFGGRSAMEVQVALSDEQAGRTLTTGTVEGKAPTKTTLFSSSSMALAIDLVGEEVARFVLSNI